MKSNKTKNRTWLNDYESHARSIVSVNWTTQSFEADWAIADCNKQINLEFGIWPDTWRFTKAESKKTLKKIQDRKAKLEKLQNHLDIILEELIHFEDAFKAAVPDMIKKAEEDKKKPKKNRIQELMNDLNYDGDQ